MEYINIETGEKGTINFDTAPKERIENGKRIITHPWLGEFILEIPGRKHQTIIIEKPINKIGEKKV